MNSLGRHYKTFLFVIKNRILLWSHFLKVFILLIFKLYVCGRVVCVWECWCPSRSQTRTSRAAALDNIILIATNEYIFSWDVDQWESPCFPPFRHWFQFSVMKRRTEKARSREGEKGGKEKKRRKKGGRRDRGMGKKEKIIIMMYHFQFI